MDLKVWILSLLVGLVFGAIVTLMKLPLPAPPVFSGVLGIVGVYLGAQLVEWLRGMGS